MSERVEKECNDLKKVLMVGKRKRGRGNEGAPINYPPACPGSKNRFESKIYLLNMYMYIGIIYFIL